MFRIYLLVLTFFISWAGLTSLTKNSIGSAFVSIVITIFIWIAMDICLELIRIRQKLESQ